MSNGLKDDAKAANTRKAIQQWASTDAKQTLGRNLTSGEMSRIMEKYVGSGRTSSQIASIGEIVGELKNSWLKTASTLDGLGMSPDDAKRAKIHDNFSNSQLQDFLGTANTALGRDVSHDEFLGALEKIGYTPNTNAFGNIINRLQQREQGIAALQTNTGGSLSQDQLTQLKGSSDADFNRLVDDWSRNFTPGAGHTDNASRVIKDILGRDATADEIQYFGRKIASGEFDPTSLAEKLKQTSEYQNVAAGKAREQLGQQAQGIDAQWLKQVGDQIPGSFMAMGRGNTSAMTAQFANAARDMGIQRQQFLMGMGAQDLGQNRSNDYQQFMMGQQRQLGGFDARQQYATYLQQQGNAQRQNFTQGGLGQIQNQANMAQQRQWQLQDAASQQNAYNSYLNQNRGQSFQNNLFDLFGAGLGAYGRIKGAQAGG